MKNLTQTSFTSAKPSLGQLGRFALLVGLMLSARFAMAQKADFDRGYEAYQAGLFR